MKAQATPTAEQTTAVLTASPSNNLVRGDHRQRVKMVKSISVHLKFVISYYRLQYDQQRHFARIESQMQIWRYALV